MGLSIECGRYYESLHDVTYDAQNDTKMHGPPPTDQKGRLLAQ